MVLLHHMVMFGCCLVPALRGSAGSHKHFVLINCLEKLQKFVLIIAHMRLAFTTTMKFRKKFACIYTLLDARNVGVSQKL
jgi:hypothetical protein